MQEVEGRGPKARSNSRMRGKSKARGSSKARAQPRGEKHMTGDGGEGRDSRLEIKLEIACSSRSGDSEFLNVIVRLRLDELNAKSTAFDTGIS